MAALPVSHKEDNFSTEKTEEKTESLEERLEFLLSRTEGIGEVKAMVMTEEQKDVGGFSLAGTPKVTGVLIAAQGAGQPMVVREIKEAVQALFQLEPHKIKITKLKVTVQQ